MDATRQHQSNRYAHILAAFAGTWLMALIPMLAFADGAQPYAAPCCAFARIWWNCSVRVAVCCGIER